MRVREAWIGGTSDTRRARAREFVLFAASTVLYQGARFVFSLAAAHALAPGDFTAWALAMAFIVYAPSLLLGVVNGMSRELPILTGRGSSEAADRAVAAGWTATIAAAALLSAAAGAVTVAADTVISSTLLVGLLGAGTIVFGTQQFILRSSLRFDAASAQQASFGVIAIGAAAILASGGTAAFSHAAALYGVGLLVAVILGVALTRPMLPSRDVDEVRRLGGIGFPIMLAGLIFSLFVTLDRWVAVTLLGPERAAPYALASLIATAVLVLPNVISQQTYPRMAIARGEGASAASLLSMARRQGLLAAGVLAPVAIAIALFTWLVIPILLPAYASAAPATAVLSTGFVVLAYLTGYGNYLNVVGGQWRYVAAQAIGVACALGLMFVGGRAIGLIGIALGMAAGHVIYGFVLRAVALRFVVAEEGQLRDRTQG